MSNKEVYINGVKVLYGTSIKASPETSLATTTTFDGPVNSGTDKIPYTIEISKLRYEGLQEHKEMDRILNSMLVNPATVTVKETVITATETYTIVDHYFGGLIDGNDYEIKPDDHTVENLKIKCESKSEREYEWVLLLIRDFFLNFNFNKFIAYIILLKLLVLFHFLF